MNYEGQKQLAEPARGASELWRLAVGLVLIAALYLVLGYSYFTILSELVTPADWPSLATEIDNGTSPRGMLALLASFGTMIIALSLVLPHLHGRSLFSLMGSARSFYMDGARVSTALLGLAAILWLLPEPNALQPFQNIDYSRWLALLPLSLPLLAIQVSAEELLFRGYIQSQLSARFDNPIIWLVVPSLVFGALHYDTQAAGANAWALALSASLFGFIAADVTARSGTLAPAIALHFFINYFALIYVAPGDTLYGVALYTYPFELSDPSLRHVWLPYDLMILLCAWLAARLSMGR